MTRVRATTTTSDSAAAPTEAQEEQSDPAADKRIAEEAGLVLEDFPTGWQQNDGAGGSKAVGMLERPGGPRRGLCPRALPEISSRR
jgi:hypothetical protein